MAARALRSVNGRRDQILDVAAQLFARHGYHGVSISDIGAAVGISGPALYRHFSGKEALLADILIGMSERLLAGGRDRARDAFTDPHRALAELVAFHATFALDEPELIEVQDRDLANLPDHTRHEVRALQRTYVEIWVDVLLRVHPDIEEDSARVAAHGAFGLLNSTRHAGRDPRASLLIQRMTLTALQDL